MKLLLIMNEKCLLGNYALQIGKTGNFGLFVKWREIAITH